MLKKNSALSLITRSLARMVRICNNGYMFADLKRHLRYLFTPHHSNNYRARFLHSSYFIFYILLLIFVQSSTFWINRLNPNILGYATDISVDKILQLINTQRSENNLEELTLSPQLSTAATAKAADMFKLNYWAHVSPTGTTPWSFITGSGYRYIYAGENLAKNFETSKEVVDAWMNSPTHRANILKPEYREIGISVMNGKLQGDDTTLVVQEFGSKTLATAATLPSEMEQLTAAPRGVAAVNPQTNANIAFEKEKGSSENQTFVSPFHINKKTSIYIAEFLLGVLCLDAFYMWKFKASRMTGHTLAHIIFIMALLGAMGATGLGVIL